ncbi:hypothetical protein [Streptomyces sp. NPDC008092]|uniref:hypothetical protein n=1 Tax=Streptomyces sp. NPDC008092 TaxID=3364808 RepID=UPI0036F137B7
MRDGTCASTTRTAHLGDNVRPVRTSRYHYAHMRCAEQAAAHAPNRATRDSYYLLAAAHRAAAGRIEKRSRRALAWSDFKAAPFAELYWMAGDRARGLQRKASRLARRIRRAVSA